MNTHHRIIAQLGRVRRALSLLTVTIAIALVATPLWAAPVAAQDVQLRRVDRATVRIVCIGGTRTARVHGRNTEVDRLPALPHAGHGTGISVGSGGLVVTARHVVQGMDVIAVVRPGESTGIPARVVYVHPERDLAVLSLGGPSADHIAMPDANPRLQTSERVSASGYPLDYRERFPAAVSGVVSRQNNDGSLQLSMGVNPGNSGGPVINESDELVGILVARGDPDAGVENIAIVEPMRFVREAFAGAQTALRRAPVTFDSGDETVARILTDYVRTSDEQPLFEPTSVERLRRASTAHDTPEEAAMIAGHAWNMSLAFLEDRRATDPTRLSGADRQTAEQLLAISLRLARAVDERAPYVRLHYPVVRSIVVSNGQPYLPRQP